MNRVEAWLLHLSTAVLTITGVLYAWMHYLLKPADPFSVINHPWEPYLLKIHIVVAPVLVLAIGTILHGHILWKLENQTRTARRSGLILVALFLVMTFSGYLLQVFTADARRIIFFAHLISGVFWFALYVVHFFASLALRRSMSKQAAELNRR